MKRSERFAACLLVISLSRRGTCLIKQRNYNSVDCRINLFDPLDVCLNDINCAKSALGNSPR